MTSRLRGSAKEEPKSTSLLSSKSRTYLSSNREPRDKSTFEGSRNKVSRKDSRGKYEDFPERSDVKYDTNGYRSPEDDVDDEDPDLMYRRSRDHFGSWNIQDIIGEKRTSSYDEEKGLKNERKSRFDLFKSNGSGIIVDNKKITNGNSRSKHKSPDVVAGSDLNSKRFDSNDRKYGKSRSPDLDRDKYKLNKKNTYNKTPLPLQQSDRTKNKSPVNEIDNTVNSSRYDYEKGGYRSKNRALLQEIENFNTDRRGEIGKSNGERSSLERRYAGRNLSPENLENDKIRSLIDRFKSDSIQNDRKLVEDRQKNSGKYPSIDRRSSGRRYETDDNERFGSIGRRWKENPKETDDGSGLIGQSNNEADIPRYKSLERRNRNNGDSREWNDDVSMRKRSDTYSVVERSGRQKSRDFEDPRESSSKRRSYVYSGSPEEFDVQIQKYERALTGPRKDPELTMKNSFRDSRESEVTRRSSVRVKNDSDEILEVQERNGRHNRPLSPPEDLKRSGFNKFEDDRKTSFNAKDWYDSNKKFAVKYLHENSKIRSSDHRDEFEDESSKDNHFHRRGSPIKEQKETYFGADRNRSSPNDDFRYNKNNASSLRVEAVETHDGDVDFNSIGKPKRNSIEVERQNGRAESVKIKIRNVSEDRYDNERRSKREIFNNEETRGRNRRKENDEDDPQKRLTRDKDWTSATTPTRKIWSYREGGAQITDVDEGQPCLKCGDTCSGFLQHPWRKNCSSCKCPREAHDVCHEEWVSVRSRLGLKGDGASGSVACDPREFGLAWAPPGLPPHKVEEYFSMLPERSVPRLGTPGERYRDRQLAMQLPKQDLAKAYCRHLAPEHYTSADDFMAARNEIALDIGTVQEVLETGVNCPGCNESLKYGSLAVSAGKLGELYHPACFQCSQCHELLVDLAYCVYNDAIYCERHYAEKLKGRCAACDELIFSGEFTRAMNKDWHSGHFCCWQCDESLTGQRYVLRDEHPYCIKCYESVFANGCEECSKIIGIDSKDLSYKDKHWHEACFLCNRCRVSLVDKQFGSKVDKIYCGSCYDAQFASRCDGCGEIFRAGTKKMEYKTRQWHEKCFCCVVCKNPIGTKSFIPREQEIYCAGCYEDKFATRCVKCNKIITSGGVTYKNEPWHRECFTCTNCSTSLAGQRFTSRDEKPYCADCFGELFAKRCTACTKPITGIGGTRFISFEDRHWHNDCFICAGCKTSLVGHGFITDGDDIICPDCAKQKLM